ncbi:hypothetical protein YC2023_098650 [Brassica napus]
MGMGTELNVYRKLSKLMGSLLDRETVKGSWPRERSCRGQLQAGLGAERLGWWRNRPSVSLKWDLADQREDTGSWTERQIKKIEKETE